MASSARLRTITPQTISSAIFVSAVVLFIIAVSGIIMLSNQQNKELVEYEFKIFLQANGQLLNSENKREFSQKLSLKDQDYYLSIANSVKGGEFKTGNYGLLISGQCASDQYFQFDIKFCRPKPIPWNFLRLIFILFGLVVVISVFTMRKLNQEMVLSFKNLFVTAQITFDPNLNFSSAWQSASEMAERFQDFQTRAIEFESSKAIANIARQVAHDIRSPLSALILAIHGLSNLSDESEYIIRNSINRIKDISNDLLKRSKLNDSSLAPAEIETHNSKTITNTFTFGELSQRSFLVLNTLNNICVEKKIQLQNQDNIEIGINLLGSSEVRIAINEGEFCRVISNLLNNSIEAIENRIGLIEVIVRERQDSVVIEIKDNGKGMPNHILSRIGELGLSHGKCNSASGSGIGLFHAKSSVESWGGTLSAQSAVGIGTSIKLRIPLNSKTS